MTKYYRDYYWKDGAPRGCEPIEEITQGDSYKIVADPYNKRISIERYMRGQFFTVVYDSALLDFRQLRKPEQTAWQKLPITENVDMTVCLIRNQDDRIIFLETHYFVDSLCRQCQVSSPHGIPLSTHRMYYKILGDPFDGVVLFDHHDHPVMCKHYEFDEITQQFTTLLEEQWDMQDSLPISIVKQS